MGIDLINWNNFCYWNMDPNSMNFELQLRFLFKFETKMAGHLETLCSLLQINQCTYLDKECSKLIYKQCSSTWMTCKDQLLGLEKI
jgi:hypothetical protein